MLTCREVYGFLDEFIDDRLDVLTRLKFGSHMTLCAACRRYLATYRATLEAVRKCELTDAPSPIAVPEELIQAILASRAASSIEPGAQ